MHQTGGSGSPKAILAASYTKMPSGRADYATAKFLMSVMKDVPINDGEKGKPCFL